ncbi:MAG TPA: ATP-binding cassette domain-containing protein [Steroidobacteraceae bacterium]|nr:ATP-binding cassette domain-containing protein [Steroidobacteraceae bacterium]
MAIIELQQLTRRFGDLIAVDGITLDIADGEFFGLLGPNGAGKTTLLTMLTTLLPPTSGTARIDGFDLVRQARRVRGAIGIVFQDPSSDDTLTGYENLKLHGMLYHLRPALREQRIREVLELVELTDRRHDVVKHYSGGMRRRLELARGLMHRPRVLFLDEPTLGLDPQSREHIWTYVERLVKEERTTVVLTTHYMEEADRLCSRVAIVDRGRIVALDTPAELKRVVGGDVVVLRAAAPDLAAVRALGFVDRIDQRGDTLQLTMADAKDRLPQLLRAVGAVESVEARPASLNDVFMHYTGREMRAATAEGGWAERSMHYRSATR